MHLPGLWPFTVRAIGVIRGRQDLPQAVSIEVPAADIVSEKVEGRSTYDPGVPYSADVQRANPTPAPADHNVRFASRKTLIIRTAGVLGSDHEIEDPVAVDVATRATDAELVRHLVSIDSHGIDVRGQVDLVARADRHECEDNDCDEQSPA
jgi:hypothetical protein